MMSERELFEPTERELFTEALPDDTDDASYISAALVWDFLWQFCQDNKEYREPRELGVIAEYVEMHRKLKKLKYPLLEGGDVSEWRETPRKMLLELIAHAFLAIVDLDKASGIDLDQATFGLTCTNQEHNHIFRDCWGIKDGS